MMENAWVFSHSTEGKLLTDEHPFTIRLRRSKDGQNVIIDVINIGQPVGDEDESLIFAAGTQARLNQRFGGRIGMGLRIAGLIANLNGGYLTYRRSEIPSAEDDKVPKESHIFSIVLPAA